MARAFLLDRAAVEGRLATRYRQQRRDWLAGGGDWPLRLPLGPPSEREALAHLPQVRAWQQGWQQWPGPGTVEWVERRWPAAGTQRLPRALCLDDAQAVCDLIGEGDAWRRCQGRYRQIAARWPALAPVLPRQMELLAGWSDTELHRLLELLAWLERHPGSGLYPRQIPVPGVDSKWLERHQRVVGEWLRALCGEPPEQDFTTLSGLARAPDRLRLRLLDPILAAPVGGLRDLTAPVEELAGLALPVHQVFIVENLQTGLAFQDLPGCVVFMGRGYAVEAFGRLPWLQGLPCGYWGDLDTHGFAILDRLRRHLPHVRSLLMDPDTLLDHRALWTQEASPLGEQDLPRLTDLERDTYQGLTHHRWGPRLRLEQERIGWEYAWRRVQEALP